LVNLRNSIDALGINGPDHGQGRVSLSSKCVKLA
jgi:hypothetical protein